MAKTENRRAIHFATLDDIVAEVYRLQQVGYRSKGNWTLGQTCYHLAEWARFPMDGFPHPPLFIRMRFGMLRMTGQTERMKRNILATGFQAGTPTSPETVPQPGLVSDEAGIQKLCEVIDRMKAWQGSLHSSPLFGAMDREVWMKVTLLHGEHHLGFLSPK